jgi:2-hydroxychromene-2-carboxylate isomerase
MRWYFEFVSPYAYLQFKRLQALGRAAELQPVPILFAGVLNHWGQLGPAEIEPKRQFTYRHVLWLARSFAVPFKMPEAHPFNPLKLLRLAIYLECRHAAVERLFDFVWCDGFIPDNAGAWDALLRSLDLDPTRPAWEHADVKAALKRNTDSAIAAGVFGVPTIEISGRLFWGQDTTAMALEFAHDPEPFVADERVVAALPTAANRVSKAGR